MLHLWAEKNQFNVTEQRLVDQANQMRKSKWLRDLEQEVIRRAIEDGNYGQKEKRI